VNRGHEAATAHVPLGTPEFVVISASFLLKVAIFNLAYLVFLADSDFTTDLFVSYVSADQYFLCFVVVNAMVYLLHKGLVTLPGRERRAAPTDPKINLLFIASMIFGLTLAYLVLEQKTLSLSSSLALLAIASNSRAIALLALVTFVVGVPEAIALDEYIPIMFCAIVNVYVFLPWLKNQGRHLFYILCVAGFGLLVALATYYIAYRYSAFKLIERIFEQAAPLSWEGSPWHWFHSQGILEGMPDERTLLVIAGTWDAQFKVTYLIANAPIFGSLFLLAFAYLLGLFAARTLTDCRRRESNALKNFLKLKLLLILIEVLGEKVTDFDRIISYTTLILIVELFDQARLLSRRSRARMASDMAAST
jgi:hypothetical protein